MKLTFVMFICLQLILPQSVFASGPNITKEDRLQLLSATHNWQSALDIVSLYSSNETVSAVKAHMKRNGIGLETKINFSQQGDHYFLGKDKLIVTEKGINYNGLVFKYDFSKSYDANYLDFYNRLSANSKFSLMPLFIDTAFAESKNLKILCAELAAALTYAAFVSHAPQWVVVAGVGITIVIAGTAVAYADELGSGVAGLRDINCLANGWSVTTKEGKTIATTEDSNGKIYIETRGQSEKNQPTLATGMQAELFAINKRLCDAGNSPAIKEVKEKLASFSGTTKKPTVDAAKHTK